MSMVLGRLWTILNSWSAKRTTPEEAHTIYLRMSVGEHILAETVVVEPVIPELFQFPKFEDIPTINLVSAAEDDD